VGFPDVIARGQDSHPIRQQERTLCWTAPSREDETPELDRAVFGFIASLISVLTFHQGVCELLRLAGQMPHPYPTTRGVSPLGVPLILDLCFWGALFGLVLPRLPEPYLMWFRGLALGIAAPIAGLFIVPLIKGEAQEVSMCSTLWR
jgi:hypothetical protein